MNEKAKQLMEKQNLQIIEKLSSHFGVEVYQDDIGEDEENDAFHFFVFETGEMTAADSEDFLKQDIFVHYVSENRDDIDERTLDIISILRGIKFIFVKTFKNRYKKGDTDAYVDRITVQMRRRIKIGCQISI